jgi:hypothetical protein
MKAGEQSLEGVEKNTRDAKTLRKEGMKHR